MNIWLIFNKKCQQSFAAKQRATFNQETSTKQGASAIAKQGSIYVFTQKENSLNYEILWCLHVVLLMTATILVICPNYSEECSQTVILQRHLLWIKANADTQCCMGLHLSLNRNLFST